MKILAVGDIHGNSNWKKIDSSKYDKVILVGDIMDSRFFSKEQTIRNAEELLPYAKRNGWEIVPGNHDLQYMFGSNFRCSGYYEKYEERAKIALETYFQKDQKIKYALLYDNVLYSHAGVMNEFYQRAVLTTYNSRNYQTVDDGMIKSLNDVLNFKKHLLNITSEMRGGRSGFASLVWADFYDMIAEENYLKVNQVFGHTATSGGSWHIRPDGSWLLNIDSFQYFDYAYEIEDGEYKRVIRL